MSDIILPGSAGGERKSARDIGFACGIIAILSIFFLPIPAFLIDIGLAFSIALSVLILMVALWIERPLDFSAFPTVLLVATLLRLALNIATTRLILANGPEGLMAAGYIIGGFSKLVMSGDFVIGLTVFANSHHCKFRGDYERRDTYRRSGREIYARRYPRQANGDRRRSFSGTDQR
jgi:flagellar biosynthesis protein FlhA